VLDVVAAAVSGLGTVALDVGEDDPAVLDRPGVLLLTFVKNSFELVIYVDASGNAQQKKFTMGSEPLFPTLLREKDLRIFREKINPETILPGGPVSKWPPSDSASASRICTGPSGGIPTCQSWSTGRVVINTVEDAVRRGLVALRYMPPGGGEEWFWHSPIE